MVRIKKIKRKIKDITNTKLKLNVIRFKCNDQNPNIFDYAFILTDDEIEL